MPLLALKHLRHATIDPADSGGDFYAALKAKGVTLSFIGVFD